MIHNSTIPPSGGLILVDKPSGWTSHDVVNFYRKKLGIKKIGHTGTLDPLATGLLILLLGPATKRAQEFQKLDKVYLVEALLGFTSDTYDIDGQVKKMSNVTGQLLNVDAVRHALPTFRGQISQTVPPFSAVKIRGKKLYQYARKGNLKAVKLPERHVEIFDLELISLRTGSFFIERSPDVRRGGVEVRRNLKPSRLRLRSSGEIPDSLRSADNLVFLTLRVHCSSGTYIRSLIHDLGQALKCGAVVTALRRTRVGEYQVEDAEII